MIKLSVRGLTVGTPEFHEIAKEGESQFSHKKKLKEAYKAINKIEATMLTEKEVYSLAQKVRWL